MSHTKLETPNVYKQKGKSMNLFYEAAVWVKHKQTPITKHKLNMRYPNTSAHSNRDFVGCLVRFKRVLMGKFSSFSTVSSNAPG